MLIVFYTVKIVHICVFMTCYTSYCLCDILTVPQKKKEMTNGTGNIFIYLNKITKKISNVQCAHTHTHTHTVFM
jgi:hypothetical protein